MSLLDNKDLLIKAINSYSLYTKKQRSFLQYLINFSIEGEVKFNTSEASSDLKLSRASIYLTLDKFEKEGLLRKKKVDGERLNSYILNIDKLDHILKYYSSKQAFK